ncbi:MAG TPA: translation factor GTPase family protein [Jiangellaceae bacterium]
MPARSLNLGILAHVDAGKTTLTERLLHLAGVIDEPGSVDSGTTRTDTLALERRRGITIKAAVVAFPIGDTTVNVVDTPGHPDFISEVERVLAVLDGAVLVLSAVEGVQPQTRILMRALQRLHVPTLLFINKIDRMGADPRAVLAAVRARLTSDVLAMGSVTDPGSRAAGFSAFDGHDAAFGDREAAALAEHDDTLLAAYVEGRRGSADQRRAALAAQTRACVMHPVFAGSAVTGAGVLDLMRGIDTLLPAAEGEPDASASGRVFKIERGIGGEKLAYVRMVDGSVRPRQRLDLPAGRVGKVSSIEVFEAGRWTRAGGVTAGQIGRLHGLAEVRVGDTFGRPGGVEQHHFAPPTLEASVTAVRADQGPALRSALAELADQDPLINVRTGDDGLPTVSLYGQVQQEVLESTLAEVYGIDVAFADAGVLHVERPRHSGAAVARLNTDTNPYQATIGLRISPGRPGSGLRFANRAVPRDMPLYLYKSAQAFTAAIDRHVQRALEHGLYGWRVTDALVTLTEVGYSVADGPPSRRGPTSTAYDYRQVTPVVVAQALRRAGTRVCEPVVRVLVEVPTSDAVAVQQLLTRWGAQLTALTAVGDLTRLEVRLVAGRLHHLQRQLPDLTGGEGSLEPRFDGYEPVHGPPPIRLRTESHAVD